MTSNAENQYEMTMSLNVLNHLGIGLYSNVPAVLSEAIANAWDADASRVDINIDVKNGKITIQDDGHGMSVSDANQKYLTVGYERRVSDGATSPQGRPVMGRKGIGKLSLFSVANTVEVHSVKDGERHGFRMKIDEIKATASAAGNSVYNPKPVPVRSDELENGTRIVLTDMKRRLNRTGPALRRRLARRFSIMGDKHGFSIILDGTPISIQDRGYHDKLQYIWTLGDLGDDVADISRSIEYRSHLSPNVTMPDTSTHTVDGWIGTARKPGDLKDPGTRESINAIVIMVRGKLAQENILDEFGDESLYSEYVIGEIHADFLDLDDQDDIATSSRQRLIEEDPRYQSLKNALESYLRIVQADWRKSREGDGTKVAIAIPQIDNWYRGLNPDHRKNAGRLFGRINQLTINDETEKRRIFIGAILAFESLKFRNMLNRLEHISTDNLGALAEVFQQLDDLEQSAYYQIIKDRIDVIRALNALVDDNAKERAMQEHLYGHLWLLDPSWERATSTAHMESRIYTALDGVYDSLSEEEQKSRFDIHYTTTGNKHVIIELKRANRVLGETEIFDQIRRYYNAALQVLRATSRDNEPLELICVLGRDPREWGSTPGSETRHRDSLASYNARIVMYDELIENALQAYQDYVDNSAEAGRVYELIRSIRDDDVDAMHPDA